jgi:hypothetical protein
MMKRDIEASGQRSQFKVIADDCLNLREQFAITMAHQQVAQAMRFFARENNNPLRGIRSNANFGAINFLRNSRANFIENFFGFNCAGKFRSHEKAGRFRIHKLII